MKKTMASIVVLAIGFFMLGPIGVANAEISWNWAFDSERGQFVTDGDTPVPGSYKMLDFSVTSSATDGKIGSLSEGDYSTKEDNLATSQPFSFVWDGSQVTKWLHSGSNTFDWWSFTNTTDLNLKYYFAWDTGNINDPTRAAHRDRRISYTPLAVGDVTVTPIPEPGSITLLFGGLLIGLIWRKHRKQ